MPLPPGNQSRTRHPQTPAHQDDKNHCEQRIKHRVFSRSTPPEDIAARAHTLALRDTVIKQIEWHRVESMATHNDRHNGICSAATCGSSLSSRHQNGSH
jgi:hypothetical protein